MDRSDESLIGPNPRDELIHEIALLREQKLKANKEAKIKARAEYDEYTRKLKKRAYELSFKKLVENIFRIDEEDIKKLSREQINELGVIIYETSLRKWKIQRWFVYLAAATIVLSPILIGFDDTAGDLFKFRKIVRLHKWYQENFGSVANAILIAEKR